MSDMELFRALVRDVNEQDRRARLALRLAALTLVVAVLGVIATVVVGVWF